MTTPAATPRDQAQGFRHEAFLYSGEDEFLRGTLPFIRDGVERDEPVLVVVSAGKIELLRAHLELNGKQERVLFADMEAVGRNPARIIPAWRDFVSAHSHPDRPIRGIGEPIHPERSANELVECHRHESLLNLAFADTPAFWLMCPYDTDALDRVVIEHALRNHPFVRQRGSSSASSSYGGLEQVPGALAEPLPEPAADPREQLFDASTLSMLRTLVRDLALDAGIDAARTNDLVLSMSEIAANSILHGGGKGLLRAWRDDDAVVCEVRDEGCIDEPLVGRKRPATGKPGGRGLWLANQLCELVQLRSFATGNVVRLHMSCA